MLLNKSLHKNILIQILKDIYSDTSLAPFLGFKGGTAAFMFYELSRFSTDLDFDLLDPTKEEEVFAAIEKIVTKYGVIKEKRIKRFSIIFVLSYEDISHNIKVEINRREFGSQFELKSYFGIPMLVMRKEDMFAHKLVAMYERMGQTNRDIFDVWFFLKQNWEINVEIVEKRTKMGFTDFLEKCILELEKLPNRGILSGVGELLETAQKTWVKEHLKKDTIFLLHLRKE